MSLCGGGGGEEEGEGVGGSISRSTAQEEESRGRRGVPPVTPEEPNIAGRIVSALRPHPQTPRRFQRALLLSAVPDVSADRGAVRGAVRGASVRGGQNPAAQPPTGHR